MRTNQARQHQYASPAEEMGIGPKKTALILFTVVGCIAILFPKIFYPMLMGPSAPKGNRDPIDLLRQERPGVRDEVYTGMTERGRAIPPHTVPILERPGVPGALPPFAPRVVERRPGAPFVQGQPGPNMRAAAFQAQQHQKSQNNSTSILMPIYTIGIVAFFVFTIVKIIMKRVKKKDKTPVEAKLKPDPIFAEKVFRPTQATDPKKHKLEWKDHNTIFTAIQGIIDATTDQLNEIEKECTERHKVQPNENEEKDEKTDEKIVEKSELTSDELMKMEDDENKENQKPKTEHDLEIEKRLDLLKEALHVKAVENDEKSDLKSIFLDGELPHDPSILVSATETETKTERISKYTDEIADDEAVVLSGKMTISFLSLSNHHDQDNEDEKIAKVEEKSTTEA